MNFVDKLKFAFTNNGEDILRKWVTGMDFTGGYPSDQVTDVSSSAALKYSAFWACNRVLSETFATLPAFEFKTDMATGDRNRTDDTGLYDILHNQYNGEMSAFNAKECSMYNIGLGGNAVFTRQYNVFGQIIGLVPHQWQNVKIKRSRETNELVYEIKLANDETQKFSRDEVYHIPGPSLDGVIGMSPLEYAGQAINLGLTYQTFSNRFYKNGVQSSGVFEKDGVLSPEAFARLKGELSQAYAGLHNSGKAIIAEDGLKFKQLTMKLADAELLLSKKFQVEDICRIYRVPLHLVQSLDHATNNNIEQQSLEFVIYTMLPHVKRQEDAIKSQLLTKEQRRAGYYFEYNLSALLRGDTKSMYEAFAVARQWGWLSVNDIRRLLNMNSIGAEGDRYLEPLNMTEAGEINPKVSEEVKNILKGAPNA